MKKTVLILALTFSASLLASEKTMIFPQLYNFGWRVEVSVWNYTDRMVSCSGSVYMTYESGKTGSEYFFTSVPARFTMNNSVYPRINERVRSVSHGISCF